MAHNSLYPSSNATPGAALTVQPMDQLLLQNATPAIFSGSLVVVIVFCLLVLSRSSDNWRLGFRFQSKVFGSNVFIEKTKPKL